MKLVHAGQAVVLAGAFLAGPFTLAAANATTAEAPTQLGAKFTANIVARHSGKCLEVYGASTADGAKVDQWTCHNQPYMEWRLA
ncbi:RICIN domain-containing protein [Nonomuraea sp. NPDC050451]|uniref:RICIN domain-containing protein n=1 Tax=Nonomuraea sp. NPDC050451 TaxID=3364364 RepID=UPI00378D1508